ncbi:ABC transporter ATP-binding protein [Thermus islandicus]|uniref:ABC transporter ATP-binding protein n=1 Tax=Thermus islandicus TaxID=540988 RepID=UPI0003B5CCDA|nr:ABC transporter ATP-binding protein [Thermus islandicus]
MLRVKGLSVSYGGVIAVSSLDLEVPSGKVVALLGANGAGKTSTLAAIAGLVPALGQVWFGQAEISDLPTPQRVALGLSLVPEGGGVFSRLSVEQNLQLGAYRLRDPKEYGRRLERVYTLFPRLYERRSQVAGTLSGGERQMLAIGRALMSQPRFLMVDEPSLGLSPLMVDVVFSALAQLHREGITLLLVEQRVVEALELADYAYVLQSGRIVLSGPAAELKASDHVRKAYLGL